MAGPSRTAAFLVSLAVVAVPAVAQVIPITDRPEVLHVATRSAPEVQAWDAQLTALVQNQTLALTAIRVDSTLSDRYHESYRQLYGGIPVEGGGVTRQLQAGSPISIIGTIYTDIDVNAVPALSPDAVLAMLGARTNAAAAFGQAPALVIVPRLVQGYALAYRVTLSDQTTYYVDAHTGSILRADSERVMQGTVGVGTGARGDLKKISTTPVNGTFRTEDQLRGAGIRTFDTRFSDAALNRLLSEGVAFDSDFGTDADNSWSDARLVDAHVYTGWSHDYFATRHNWRGTDGAGSAIVSIVHGALTDNAFFIGPPFGPGHGGAMVFGDSHTGQPMARLDTVAHEYMHGVTSHALMRRTGQALGSRLYIDRLGPSSFRFNGQSFACQSSVLVYADGTERPFVCDGSRYVLVSNHPGDINEGFSDVFGTSAEFFFGHTGQPGDYTLEPRRIDDPGAAAIPAETGPAAYPDHVSRRFAFAVVVVEGSRSNPRIVDVAPIAFVGDHTVARIGPDNGGVHLNSTVLSHAFFLAVEGGRNATSGVSVTGVGAQNREQIERIFFRAMTELMPATPNLAMAAAAIRQAAADLFGGTSAPARAVSDALTAVGLP